MSLSPVAFSTTLSVIVALLFFIALQCASIAVQYVHKLFAAEKRADEKLPSPRKSALAPPDAFQFFPASTPCSECADGALTCDNALMHELFGKFVGFRDAFASGRWDYRYRLPTGATIFHFILLGGTETYGYARRLIETLKRHGHTDAGRFLLSSSYLGACLAEPHKTPDECAASKCAGPRISEYDGENALHMVIAHRPKNLDMVRWLCTECPALVQGRAVGKFFLDSPYDDHRSDDTCPWGEYPLSFAVALNEPSIIKFLVDEAGADMLAQDSNGNTALHTAVKNKASVNTVRLLRELWVASRQQPDFYANIIPQTNAIFPELRWKRDLHLENLTDLALDDVVNSAGLTAVMLSAKLDSEESTRMFEVLADGLYFGRGISWMYAHVTCFAYPLKGLDDIWDISLAAQAADTTDENEAQRREALGVIKGIQGATTPRVYPNPFDVDEENFQTAGVVAVHALSEKPQLWPRRTLLDVLSDESVSNAEGVAKLEFTKTILEKKWIMFAGSSVLLSFVATLAFLLCLTGVVLLRAFPATASTTTESATARPALRLTSVHYLQTLGFGRAGVCFEGEDGGVAVAHYGCESLVILEFIVLVSCCASAWRIAGAWSSAAREALARQKRAGEQSLLVYFAWLTDSHGSTFFGRFFSLSITSLVGVLAALVHFGAEDHAAFYFLLSTTSVLGWLSLVRFAMGWSRLAHFVIMIKQMFQEDITRFLGIASILVASFAHAFFILGRFHPKDAGLVLFRSLLALVGEGEVEVESDPRQGITVFQVSFLIIGSLIFLNVLIAMMSKTCACLLFAR